MKMKTVINSTGVRTRRERAARIQVNYGSPGGRNHFVMAKCTKHGLTAHLSWLGGACCKCQDEGLVAQGLVKP